MLAHGLFETQCSLVSIAHFQRGLDQVLERGGSTSRYLCAPQRMQRRRDTAGDTQPSHPRRTFAEQLHRAGGNAAAGRHNDRRGKSFDRGE